MDGLERHARKVDICPSSVMLNAQDKTFIFEFLARNPFRRKEVTKVKVATFLAVIFFVSSIPAGRAQSPRRIEIIAKRFTYDPDVITLKRGEPACPGVA